ncbi:hypothetical protein [Roseateles sp. LYH14W]|uniref:Uncharacterized protein n=1 Tax=Pelomonas parva TaxID=3299032 RepID=A0ABW7EX29_9BURK
MLPCYNEEALLHETASRLGALLAELKADGLIAQVSSAYYIDDGSRDGARAPIETLARGRLAASSLLARRSIAVTCPRPSCIRSRSIHLHRIRSCCANKVLSVRIDGEDELAERLPNKPTVGLALQQFLVAADNDGNRCDADLLAVASSRPATSRSVDSR